MIRLGFDARMIRHSGIGTYIRSVLPRILKEDGLDVTLYGDLGRLADYSARKVLAPFPIYSLREQIFFPVLLRRDRPDLFHSPHYNAPLGCPGRLIVTIHDLIHLRFPPSRTAYLYARGMIEAVSRKARVVITDSWNTLRDLTAVVGVPEKKIRVISPGVDAALFSASAPPPDPDAPPYILYVGNVRPAKNVMTLIEAFLRVKPRLGECRLVIAGKNTMEEATRPYSSREDIRFLGEVPPSSLPGLYRNARLFVFPSLYEGFGLPPLEAMASGTPVISSNAASLPEAVGDAALLFDPGNSGELAEKIAVLWNDAGLREDLVKKGRSRVEHFTWERTAEDILKVYRE